MTYQSHTSLMKETRSEAYASVLRLGAMHMPPACLTRAYVLATFFINAVPLTHMVRPLHQRDSSRTSPPLGSKHCPYMTVFVIRNVCVGNVIADSLCIPCSRER